MIKVGYNELPNFKDINFDQSRQGILFNQLVKEGKIDNDKINSLIKTTGNSSHWIEMKHKHNKVIADYIDTVATQLLKEGAIYESLDKVAENTVKRSIANGGATIYTTTGLAAAGGYAVAIESSPEEKYGDLTVDTVKEYIEKHYDNYLKNEGYFLGTWLNEGTWYLDVSELIVGGPSLKKKVEALRLAKDRGEKAIYDLYNFEEVFVEQLPELEEQLKQEENQPADEPKEEGTEVEKVVNNTASVNDIVNLSNKLFK